MPKTILERLRRKPVEVISAGILYRGMLVEATATEITLRGPTGYISIPMERVTSVREPGAKETSMPRYVDPSFYGSGEEET